MVTDAKVPRLDDDNGDGGNLHGETTPDTKFPGYHVKRNGNVWSFSKSHQGLYLDHSAEYKIPNSVLNSEQSWDTGWRRVPYDVDVRSSMFPRHFKECTGGPINIHKLSEAWPKEKDGHAHLKCPPD